MKEYIQKNLVPVLIEILFIVSFFVIPKEYALYTNFFFLASLAIWFASKKSISFKEWKEQLYSGKYFWAEVLRTVIILIIAYGVTGILEGAFPGLDTGMILLRCSNWLELMLFALSTVFLPPVVEETFFRQSMISFRSKTWMIVTLALSTFLFAMEHALKPFGLLITAIWSVPFAWSYIRRRNIYIPMTAHFITNAVVNGISVILVIANWIVKV